MMLAGLTPRTVVEPPSVDEVAACVATLYARDTPFAFTGGGTQMELGNPPTALDTLVRTTALKRVVDYAPQDQTITVEAGMTLSAVAVVLANERQFLAIDAPQPDATTVGGAIATNLYGRRRLRYGSIKDQIVGVELIRPDGTRARGGGKVVKNVAGFDMPKLMVGSLGTLGAIALATFRVYPIEEERAAVVYHALTVEKMMQLCDALVSDALVPSAVVAFEGQPPDRYDCCVTFEGFARGVEQQVKAATTIAFRLRASAGAYAVPFAAAFDERERAVRTTAPWRVTVSARPTVLARFLAGTPFAAGTRRAVYPLLGAAFLALDALDAGTLASWRAALEGGSVVVNAMPDEARSSVETWGDPLTRCAGDHAPA